MSRGGTQGACDEFRFCFSVSRRLAPRCSGNGVTLVLVAIYGCSGPIRRLARCQTTFLQKHQPFEVIACRLDMQSEGYPDDTDAAHQFAAHLRQRAKNVLDTRVRCGDATVTVLLRLGDALGGATFALDVDAPAGLFQRRFRLKKHCPLTLMLEIQGTEETAIQMRMVKVRNIRNRGFLLDAD